jgi:predicted MFS family arabinose efflux permease
VRVLVALVVLSPLGLCLGTFMPLGLGLVTRLTDRSHEYVAWSWAVNGFFSVIGSVLTTILAMSYGFRAVQLTALAVYAVAVVVFLRLRKRVPRHETDESDQSVAEPVVDSAALAPTASG